MDWYIHHVNVPSHDIALARAFYRDVIGLEEGEWSYPAAEKLGQVGHNRDTLAYFGTGNRGLHVVKPIVTFSKDNGFFHNPTVGGHFAITVADLEPVMQRFDEAGILYSDARTYAMAGVHQIYVYEPSMKVLEINQIVDERAGPPPRRGEQHSVREEPGGWSLHHVNMQAFDVRQTAAFLSDIIGIREGAWDYPDSLQMGGTGRSNAALATFGEGYLGIHAVRPMVEFAKNNNLTHNPTIGGHFAITVPDATVVMQRLKAAGIPFDDAGSYAMKGMRQVYTFDPSMNFVEINQVM